MLIALYYTGFGFLASREVTDASVANLGLQDRQ